VLRNLIGQIKFPHNSEENRLGKSMLARLNDNPPMISKRDVGSFWRLIWRYRRHIVHPRRAHYFHLAEKLMVPSHQKPLYIQIQNLEYKLKKLREQQAKEDAQWIVPAGKTLCEVFAEEEQKSVVPVKPLEL
jgi:hypothetical protein